MFVHTAFHSFLKWIYGMFCVRTNQIYINIFVMMIQYVWISVMKITLLAISYYWVIFVHISWSCTKYFIFVSLFVVRQWVSSSLDKYLYLLYPIIFPFINVLCPYTHHLLFYLPFVVLQWVSSYLEKSCGIEMFTHVRKFMFLTFLFLIFLTTSFYLWRCFCDNVQLNYEVFLYMRRKEQIIGNSYAREIDII